VEGSITGEPAANRPWREKNRRRGRGLLVLGLKESKPKKEKRRQIRGVREKKNTERREDLH